MKRNCLYVVECWREQSKKDAALQIALLMAVPGLVSWPMRVGFEKVEFLSYSELMFEFR
jgi:hypothetical protein